MIGPIQNWQEFEWCSTEGVGGVNFQELNAFVWRVSVNTIGGGTVTYQHQNGVNRVVTLAAGELYGAEPCGMRPGGFVIQFSAGITHWVVEWIRRVQ